MPQQTEEMTRLQKEQDEERQERREVAGRIMVFARDQIMVSMRYLDRALFRMPFVPTDTVEAYGVDGLAVYFNEDHVLKDFWEERNRCTRAFLHMILHCIFQHPFHYEDLDCECWDLAADIATEKSILDLQLSDVALISDERITSLMKMLQRDVPVLTAEKIYRFLMDDPEKAAVYKEHAQLFARDDHRKWIPRRETDAAERTGDTITTDTLTAMVGCHEADTGEEGAEQVKDIDEAFVGRTQDEWADVSEHAKMDIETFSREQGFGAGHLLWNLKETLREKVDYGEFLRKFSVLGEEMHINDDEFDYIYYTYGMQLYGNMPLVEPLEYRENKRIREFVIAIDTSGSCQGVVVERFLRKTYEILKNTESYFTRVNLHIIQCDAKIQSDVKVTSEEDFDDYMENVRLSGFGGTDFRPVFDYVDGLVERHEFQNLRGLIYFTDGLGTFPERQPDYETAFVFVDDGFRIPEVPSWAIKLVLREDEV